MVIIGHLPFLLLLLYPLYIRGDYGYGGQFETEEGKRDIEWTRFAKLERKADSSFDALRQNFARQREEREKALDKRQRYQILPEYNNCAEIDEGKAQGVHLIYPTKRDLVHATCDNTNGGGWTVIQKRVGGCCTDFYKGWEEYADGFGDPSGDYWLGLRHIHQLTKSQPFELYIGLTDFDVGLKYARYSTFSVTSEEDKFRLLIGGYSGNAGGDCMSYSNGTAFSTKDQDNDSKKDGQCSHDCHGGWWYKYCSHSNLNGRFIQDKPVSGYQYMYKYMFWYDLHDDQRPMKATVMMIRPANFGN